MKTHHSALTFPSVAALRRAHHALLAWYEAHGRKELPWRTTRDAYAIYVSEIMLQQTQVKTVLERYYHPFLATFPTLQDLANAAQEDVLKAWEGLGYYSRARALHQAAQQAAPALPRSVEGLLALPGIGKNTAHAVAAFAYHTPVPVMEANVKRVLTRVFALANPTEAQLWEGAEHLLCRDDPFTYNQAMMDIGAMVCTKRAPQCGLCPLQTLCVGKAAPEAYPDPATKTRKATPTRKRYIMVVQRKDGALWVEPRQTRFLHGLYGFVELAAADASVCFGNQVCDVQSATHCGAIRHVYSHFALHAEVYHLTLPLRSGNITRQGGEHGSWAKPAVLADLPLSGADHKVLALLKNRLEK